MMEITNPFVHASWAQAKHPAFRKAVTPQHTLKLIVSVLGSLGMWPQQRIQGSQKFAKFVWQNEYTYSLGYIYVVFGVCMFVFQILWQYKMWRMILKVCKPTKQSWE